jgi:luciferase family oxidoreductase group 1
MKIGILDHVQISEGRTAQDALAESALLAKEAEKLGFSRFWVSEHHGSKALAGSSPEIMIAHLAAATSTIRVGSGGVMLPHYSAYKVAENFRLLEALHPGRIDLGIGRAPGGMPLSTRALQEHKVSHIHHYPQQVADLAGYLRDALPENHRFSGLRAAPSVSTVPELWLLGSSGESARVAAEQGASFAFAQFFGTPGGEEAIRQYKKHFRPSALNASPRTMIAVMAVCADTQEEAEHLAGSSELFFLQLTKGQELPWFPSAQTAAEYPYTPFEERERDSRRQSQNVGTPATVKERLMRLAESYQADELVIVSSVHDFQARLHSIRLIAEAFGLSS